MNESPGLSPDPAVPAAGAESHDDAASPGETPWIGVGRLLRARGRIGELTAIFDSPHPDRAEQLGRVKLRLNGVEREVELERVWFHDAKPVLKFSGVDSISDAERWAGAEILVPESERVELQEDEYFHEDLIGCRVEGADSAGVAVSGTVAAVEEWGGPPLLRIVLDNPLDQTLGDKPPGDKARREALVPFVRALCTEVDIAGRRIRVSLPEGLIDL